MDRINETWLDHLQGCGPEQERALSDLRAALLRGLRRALSGHPHASEAFLEDVAQDALLRVLDRLGQFEGRSRFVTWATSITIRIAMSELRRRRWRDVALEDLVGPDGSFDRPEAPHGAAEPARASARRAILDQMYTVIRSELTDKQRSALLAELRGMPQDEIARHLGSTRNALYKLTHDARKRLKRGLEAAGYGAGDVRAAFTL